MSNVILEADVGEKGDLIPQQRTAYGELDIPALIQVRCEPNKELITIFVLIIGVVK